MIMNNYWIMTEKQRRRRLADDGQREVWEDRGGLTGGGIEGKWIRAGVWSMLCWKPAQPVMVNPALFVSLSLTHMHINIHKYSKTPTATIASGPWDLCVEVFGNGGWPVMQSISHFPPSGQVHFLFFIPHCPPPSCCLTNKQNVRMWGPTHWEGWLSECELSKGLLLPEPPVW